MIEAGYQQKQISAWLSKLISANECGTVIGLPNSGVSRVIQNSIDGLSLSDHFGVIDLSLAPRRKAEMITNLRNTLNSFLVQGVNLIKINNLKLYRKRGIRQLFALNSIRNELGRKLNFVFHLTFDPTIDCPDISRIAYGQLLFQNTFYLPFALSPEFEMLVKQLEKRFSARLNTDQLQKTYSLSGGCPFLVKNIVKHVADNKEVELSIELSTSWASQVLADFRPSLLSKIKLAKLSIAEKDVLIKLGFVDKSGVIRSQILRQYIATMTMSGSLSIDTKNNHILWQGQSINNELAPHEVDIINKILSDQSIMRSEIAKICYGTDDETSYSDSSIDKVMSRLRYRLAKIGLPFDCLQTIKKKGYKINNAYLGR